MFTLLLDTSCERAFVALAHEDKILFAKKLELGLFSSRELVNATHHLLQESHIDFSQIKAIAAGIGPGSFTGIRVGVSFALGLTVDKTIPLITFSSLIGFISEKNTFVSLIPAKVGGVYGQLRKREKENIVDIDSPRFFSPSEYEQAFSSSEMAVSPIFYSHPNFNLPLVEKEQDLSFIANFVERKYAQKNFSERQLDILYLRSCQYLT